MYTGASEQTRIYIFIIGFVAVVVVVVVGIAFAVVVLVKNLKSNQIKSSRK